MKLELESLGRLPIKFEYYKRDREAWEFFCLLIEEKKSVLVCGVFVFCLFFTDWHALL